MAGRRSGQRVAASELSRLQHDASRVRNVCILAHVDHGKTTLSDGLVCSNGIISSKLAGKLRYLDSTEDEQKRGITMHSSAISLLYAMPPKQRPGAPNSEPSEEGKRTSAVEEETVNKFLINLIDSPGHIDFSSDVSTATRLCDCGLVVVDVLEEFLKEQKCQGRQMVLPKRRSEIRKMLTTAFPLLATGAPQGVCAQTHAVFRQAWAERMRPLLVLNKVDRLASELQLTPLEAWHHLQRLVENVNALTATLLSAHELADGEVAAENGVGDRGFDVPGRDSEASSRKELEDQWTFSPENGDVVFCSALDGWGFGLGNFARIWAKRLGCKPRELRRMLWGSFVLNPKTKKVSKWTPSSAAPPMFVSMILDPIWQLYDAAMKDHNGAKAGRMAVKLGLEVPPRELESSEPRTVLQAVMKRWLPVSEAVLRMIVEQGPSPATAQSSRVDVLWPQTEETSGASGNWVTASAEERGRSELGLQLGGEHGQILRELDRVQRAVALCDASESAPVVVFVSKMVAVKRRNLTDIHGRPWRYPNPENRGSSETTVGVGGGGIKGDDPDALAFVAFARVLSGTVTPRTPLLVLGPKYHPLKPGAWRHASPVVEDSWIAPEESLEADNEMIRGQRTQDNQYGYGQWVRRMDESGKSPGGGDGEREGGGPGDDVALFMMMGSALQPVERVPAGNVLALAGLEGKINKCATLSDTSGCPAMGGVTLQAKPMVRVAVEAAHQQDMDKLELGLSRLYQADPAVEVSVTPRGEHVLCCLGELHLEQSLKDLRERYAGVEVKASLPLVPFRETAVAPGQLVSEDGIILQPPQLTIAPWSDEEGLAFTDYKSGRVRVVTPDRRVALTLRCLPLPKEFARVIEDRAGEVPSLLEELRKLSMVKQNGDDSGMSPSQSLDSLGSKAGTRFGALYKELVGALEAAPADSGGASGATGGSGGGAEWAEDAGAGFLARVLALGPRNVGANVLARCAGGVAVEVCVGGDALEESPEWAFRDKAGAEDAKKTKVREASEGEASEAMRLIQNSVGTGFQLAALTGPLAGEEMHGICFLLERVELTQDCFAGSSVLGQDVFDNASTERGGDTTGSAPADGVPPEKSQPADGIAGDGGPESKENGSVRGELESVDGGSARGSSVSRGVQQQSQQRRYGPLSGQIISIVRMGCRASMLCCPVRLVEAFYRCSLQCDQQQLGNMYGVLSKRRGRVVDEDLVDGTQLFLLTAFLPVAESFGFANELLKKTSGAGTTPQLAFSHWEVMDMDPFWRPQTNEEREDEGEEGHLSVNNIARQYLDSVRRRKGLAMNEKIVVAAEKQRTLTRNK